LSHQEQSSSLCHFLPDWATSLGHETQPPRAAQEWRKGVKTEILKLKKYFKERSGEVWRELQIVEYLLTPR
jgi:hypothetical protein